DEIVGDHIGAVPARCLDQSRKPLWMHEVVAVHDGDPLAPCHRQRPVTRGGGTSVPVATHYANTVIFRRQSNYYPYAIIGSGVIEDDDLEVAKALSLSRRDRLGQMCSAVVVGHDDADARRRNRVLGQVGRLHRAIRSRVRISWSDPPTDLLARIPENSANRLANNPNDQPACMMMCATPPVSLRCAAPHCRPSSFALLPLPAGSRCGLPCAS